MKKKGFEIIGISPDEEKSHKKFEEKHQLPFTLLADPDRKIIEKYGVWAEKQMYGRKYMGVLRTTFLVNEKGILLQIIAKPKSKDHAAEIIAAFARV